MPALRHVLIADDEVAIRHVLTLVLADPGSEVRPVSDGEEALKELSARDYDVVLSDVRMPKLDGLQLLEKAKAQHPGLTFLVMSAYGSKDLALEAVAKGAYDFIEKPFKPEEVVFLLKKVEERGRLLRENQRLRGEFAPSGPLQRLLGESAPMQALKKQIARLAPVTSTVLITGESGTGKELVARALHELSPRAAMPFVAINCGAIAPTLIESELFGHARGAFTDAKTARRGVFSEADGGTIFLDEVGELPMAAQVKLLRVLQESEVRPVGESRSEKIDVRVVAASLRDLQALVNKGQFREDLFFRLNVVPLQVPALRQRGDDILKLARHFLERFNREFNREVPLAGFTDDAEELLQRYAWPGNVRELENALERAALLSDGALVTPAVLPEKLWSQPAAPSALTLPSPQEANYSLKRAIEQVEASFIRAALQKTKGNRTRAAELLEISHRALLYKLKDYGIDADAEGEKGGA